MSGSSRGEAHERTKLSSTELHITFVIWVRLGTCVGHPHRHAGENLVLEQVVVGGHNFIFYWVYPANMIGELAS